MEGLLRGDYQSHMNGYAIGWQNGWMSANDIRELEKLDRIPAEDGGDLYLINGNMLPLKNAGALQIHLPMTERRKNPMKKFWNWKTRTVTNQEAQEQVQERTLFLNGTIAEESWFDDDVTPQLFKDELMAGSGDITVEQQHNARKREMMERCFECYAENGLTGTGIKALADACGCTKAKFVFVF